MHLSTFQDRLDYYIDRHPTHSRSSLSLACGRSRGYISSVLQQGVQPTAPVIVRICQELSITPNALLGFQGKFRLKAADVESEIDTQAERLLNKMLVALDDRLETRKRPSIENVMAWWRQNQGKLHDNDKIAEAADLMLPPDPTSPQILPSKMGAKSLASMTLASSENDKVNRFLDSLPPQKYTELAKEYSDAAAHPSISNQSVRVDLPDLTPMDLHYVRLLLPVQDALGNRYILNYCVLTSDAKTLDT